VHEVAQRLAKGGVMLLLVEIERLGQLARPLGAVLLALEMTENFIFDLL
jgi:hypothetical protein